MSFFLTTTKKKKKKFLYVVDKAGLISSNSEGVYSTDSFTVFGG